MSLPTMTYGAALSTVLAVALVAFAAKERRPTILATAAAAAFVLPLCWNLILRVTDTTAAFSHDLPLRPFPISWQDTGSGIFTLAGAAVSLGLGAARRQPAGHTTRLALWTALAALLVDIYLY